MVLKATLKLIVPFLFIAVSAKAQTITLTADSSDVKSLFLPIQTQIGLGISARPGALDQAKKVSFRVKDKPFLKFLQEDLCKGQPFTYEIVESTIFLVRRASPEPMTAGNKPHFYWGRFVSAWGEGVEQVNVYNRQNQIVTSSDSHGRFALRNVQPGDVFGFGSTEIDTGNFILTSGQDFTIEVKYKAKGAMLNPVEVIHIGIQDVAKNRNVGSTFVLPASTLQQRTSPNIYERLEGFTPGLLLTVNPIPNTYQAKYVSIGGRSTIYSSPDPLVVVDGFRFIGRLEDLNPDNIESITVLRDASATSLWGTLSGNGALVVTTKRGKFNQPTRISFNSSISVGSKPNAFAKDILAPADRFYMDSLLARKGYYNPLLRNPAHPYVPELALRILNNTISDAELKALKQLDVRNDMNKYFYRNTLQKHLSLQITGGKKARSYLFSLGFDHSLPQLQLSKTQRLNLGFTYNVRPVDGLEMLATAATTWNREHNVEGEPQIPVSYANLTTPSGEPAVQSYLRNKFFIDTAGVDGNLHKLRDWQYRPLQEFRIRNDDRIYTDHRLQLGLTYNKFSFLKGLQASVGGQYETTGSEEKNLNDKNGFYVNNLVNNFSQINGSSVVRPIPVGDILDYSLMNLRTLNLRAQLKYTKSIGRSSFVDVLLGSDRMMTRGTYTIRRIYNYTIDRPEGESGLNYQTLYPQYYFPASSLYIPYLNEAKRTANNYISYYTNVNLQLKGKYFASLAARTDHSNLYGSNTNGRFRPLGSIGLAWDISAEDFYHPRLFELLKLRSSIGLSGNPPLGLSAVQTISLATGKNENGDLYGDINNPSRPDLRSELVTTYNLGVTFRLKRQILEGTIDYYYKKSTDLVGNKPVDPSVGFSSIWGNVASMASHNVDLYVTTTNINRLFRWRTNFLFSYLKEYVTKTDTSLQPAWMYCDRNRFSVVRHRPLYGVYSMPSSGLDETGDPVAPGKNKDYSSIILNPGPGDLRYRGRSTPPIFGSVTNEFSYKQFALSLTFTYKLNYYYRKPSVNYTGIFDGSDPGSSDFSKRWKKPGDEKDTYVPKMDLASNSSRDYFYLYSDPLVQRADFIRLHNIQFSYDLERKALSKFHMRLANFYFNCSNAGIVWRAHKSKLDPDRLQGFPQPTIFTFGFKGVLR
jgi:TonB-linked SusC/RagA family outer membrane protein